MKKNIICSIVVLLFLAGISTSAFASDVAATFDPVTGVEKGAGSLRGVPFDWKASAPIEKMPSETLLRVNNFSGEFITLQFAQPVTITAVIFYSLSSSSESKVTFYDSEGEIIPVETANIDSPDGVSDFPSALTDDGSVHFVAAWSETSYSATIAFPDSVRKVSKVKISVLNEAGLMDLRVRGSN